MASSKPISKKCIYALRALFELALRNSSEPVKICDIADSQKIPSRFLEIILSELKHGGFVESRRGNDGGYLLIRDPHRINVGEVIEFVQGSYKIDCSSIADTFEVSGDYVFNKLWNAVNTAAEKIYSNTTLGVLVESERVEREKHVPNYCI
ncbi:MAG: RrF2 family transcriptional regulator [Planctomycetota bacterium]|jgi:Rrf2 family protein